MDQSQPRDLRARRRQATEREIHEAALDLFESQGMRATTVGQIADRAGVSTRTFFRYFAGKEEAALPGQRRLEEAVSDLGFTGDGDGTVLADVEHMVEDVIRSSSAPDLAEQRRITAIFLDEPELRALARSRDQSIALILAARISEQRPRVSPLSAKLIAEVAVLCWRLTWEALGESPEPGGDPSAIYRDCRRRLRGLI